MKISHIDLYILSIGNGVVDRLLKWPLLQQVAWLITILAI